MQYKSLERSNRNREERVDESMCKEKKDTAIEIGLKKVTYVYVLYRNIYRRRK